MSERFPHQSPLHIEGSERLSPEEIDAAFERSHAEYEEQEARPGMREDESLYDASSNTGFAIPPEAQTEETVKQLAEREATRKALQNPGDMRGYLEQISLSQPANAESRSRRIGRLAAERERWQAPRSTH